MPGNRALYVPGYDGKCSQGAHGVPEEGPPGRMDFSFFPMVLFKVRTWCVFDDTQNTNYIFGISMEILWKLVIMNGEQGSAHRLSVNSRRSVP